jgi:hypothetical protein
VLYSNDNYALQQGHENLHNQINTTTKTSQNTATEEAYDGPESETGQKRKDDATD